MAHKIQAEWNLGHAPLKIHLSHKPMAKEADYDKKRVIAALFGQSRLNIQAVGTKGGLVKSNIESMAEQGFNLTKQLEKRKMREELAARYERLDQELDELSFGLMLANSIAALGKQAYYNFTLGKHNSAKAIEQKGFDHYGVLTGQTLNDWVGKVVK